MNAPVEAGVVPCVERADAGPVATLTLNRGSRYNALSSAMIEALDGALAALAADRAIRVVVLAAHGLGGATTT